MQKNFHASNLLLLPNVYIYIDVVARKLGVAKEKERGDKARNICLLFANDLAMVASNPFELQSRLNVAMETVNALGLQFNAKKSVVLVQGKKAHFFQEWRLKGEAVKRVKEAKYLGLRFEKSSEWTTHAKERITKAKQSLYSLRQRGAIAQGLGTRTARIATELLSSLPCHMDYA